MSSRPTPPVVSGFTFVRNAIKFDYPIVEAISSILPLCDEVVVAVGRSDDETLDLVRSIGSPKLRIVETVWDDSLREGGRVLAVETDKALRAIRPDAAWAVYIQGDEVLHEDGIPALREALAAHLDDPRVEGLLLDYLHFYGSYAYVGAGLRWYRREIRVVRNDPAIFSYRDAQGFRRRPNDKLRVKRVPARIHHYGWVKHPRAMQGKVASFNKYWHDDAWMKQHIPDVQEYAYEGREPLRPFDGTHPQVMCRRVEAMNWKVKVEPGGVPLRTKDRLKLAVERITGWRPGEYKNYRLI
jgi:glycosyltransferase involved in cell wall biosynthesis